MEFFKKAKTVRLRSHHDKYLWAEEDGENVGQERDGIKPNCKWTVELVEGTSLIRLRGCYNRYLTATDVPFLLGMTGKKVLQTVPSKLNSSVEWEPIREGFMVKLKTRDGNYLRANGGPPPWRNRVTHDIPHRTATQEWILWHVDVLEIVVEVSPSVPKSEDTQDLLPRPDGRLIYYAVANDNGDVEENGDQWPSFHFKGNDLEHLKRRFEEETGLHDIILCAKNHLSGKLYPLRLQLPPNNQSMHIVIVLASSEVAKDIL
eukprot:TRINITY_DN17279_c0_g1_i1.p1 TRINITY_DN17279_c0_g1~~TRINITY_DN17279_c0_g1_i1.p1  ORF type:complete len:261 (+),score=53.19 TRINITY_DN17279_c0_g1_i1:211-993(+)